MGKLMLGKYIIIGVLTHTAVFFAGYFKKGEVEAEKTTIAITEKIEEVVEVQGDLVEIGLEHADEEVGIKVQNRLIQKEVQRRVKEYTANTTKCFNPNGVLAINKALGYSGAEDNKKPAR